MSGNKVTYFNFKGLGEIIRLLLSYGGEDFEDVRIEWGAEEWTKLKPKTPFGVLPMLEIDGNKPMSQHLAVARFLAKKYGIAGDNDLEAYEIDSIVDAISDLKTKLYDALWGDDEALVAKNHEEVVKNTLPNCLERLNARAESGHLANGKLSWADLYYFSHSDLIKKVPIEDKYPNLKKVEENVLALPKIKAWIDKRPKTDF